MMYKENFGKILVQLRNKKGASARDMSRSIGKEASYLNKIEKGISRPSMDAFFDICEFLEIKPKEFFEYYDSVIEEDKLIQTPVEGAPTLLSEIVDKVSKLTEEQMEAIIAVLNQFK